MSGYSGETTCPNCGKDADLYSDWKPFDYSIITCSTLWIKNLSYIKIYDIKRFK